MTPLPADSVAHTIIVVNFNGGTILRECLESVFANTRSFELLLIDNNSADGSEIEAVKRFPEIGLIKNKENIGFAKANNIGIKRARGRWIVLLNPDTLVTPFWLESLTECASEAPDIGIVGPKLLRRDGKTIDSAGHIFNFTTAYATERGSGEQDLKQYDRLEEVLSVCFAVAAIKREVVQCVGLLDEKMKIYFEDVDYCIRARIAGWKILYCPSSIVLHTRGGLTAGRPSRIQQDSVAYLLRIILKSYSRKNAVKYGAKKVVHDCVAMAAGLKNNDTHYFLLYARALLWNIRNLPTRERIKVQSRRRTDDDLLTHLGSLNTAEKNM